MINVIDAHVHFWNLSVLRYPWLEIDAHKPLSDTFEPRDLAAIAPGLRASVHIQAGMDPSRHPADETAWIASLRQEAPDGAPIPTVAVGFADLTNPGLGEVLDRHQEYDFFRGIRQEAPYTTSEADAGRLDLLSHPAWGDGLSELARRNLTFDLLVYAHQLPQAMRGFEQVPDLAVVIDHLGHPASAADFATWRAYLEEFARRVPNSFMKLSGLSFISHDLTDARIRDHVRAALDIFGPDRCMVASNHPVDKPAGTYVEIFDALDAVTADLTPDDRHAIFVATAARFYSIDLPKAPANPA